MDLAALTLGTYAITLVLTQSEGPYGLFYKLRTIKQIDNFGLLNCYLCTAFWIALFLCLITKNMQLFFIAWGGATIIDKAVK